MRQRSGKNFVKNIANVQVSAKSKNNLIKSELNTCHLQNA